MKSAKWLALLLAVLTVLALCPLTVGATEITVVPDYSVSIGSVEVTSANCESVTGAGITFGEGGYIRFDPNTQTLTLCNASIEGWSERPGYFNPENVYIAGIDLKKGVKKLVLLGENNLTVDADGADVQVYGLSYAGTITGGGSLTISVDGGVFNMNGIESMGSLMVNDVDLTIRVASTDGKALCKNATGMRVPNGLTYTNGQLDITVGDVQNSTTGIDAMEDVALTDVNAEIRVGTGRFSRAPIIIMGHAQNSGINVGLTMTGGSLKAYSDVGIARISYIDLGEDAWYKYAVNADDMTEVYDYTPAATAPLTSEILSGAKYIHIVDADTEIVDPNANPEPDVDSEEKILVDQVTETVSSVVVSGVETIIDAIADGKFTPVVAPVLVPTAESAVASVIEQISEVVNFTAVNQAFTRVQSAMDAIARFFAAFG